MKTFLLTLVSCCILALTIVAQTGTKHPADAILGVWLTAKKDGKFQIYKVGNKYYGKVIWGTGGDKYDSKNPDPKLRNKEIVGQTLLKDFVFDGDESWDDGTIYDPREGKTYDCILKLKNANTLEVRGYVGISLFGRTETWTRVNK